MAGLDKAEMTKVQAYLRRKFGNDEIAVRARPRKNDSAEVFVGEEFLGTLYRDDDEGETSYSFTMTILDIDIDGG